MLRVFKEGNWKICRMEENGLFVIMSIVRGWVKELKGRLEKENIYFKGDRGSF